MSDMSLRPRSQRLTARATRLAAARSQHQRSTEVYPGLNDITDTFEAFPAEAARYFTLYKEIDAKYVSTMPLLLHKAAAFKAAKEPATRTKLMKEINQLLSDILPCLEEKMHVASLAADRTVAFIGKVNDDFQFIQKHEIPESVRFGQQNHPAIIHEAKLPDNKSAQSQRSESRREALAAKKAAHEPTDEDTPQPTTGRGKGRPRAEKESTPAASAPAPAPAPGPSNGTATKKRKTNSGNSAGSASSHGNSNSHPSSASNGHETQHSLSNNVSNPATAHSQLMGTFSAPASASVKEESVARPDTPSGAKRARTSTKKKQEQEQQQAEQEKEEGTEGLYRDEEGLLRNSLGEMVYCYCNQVSYGEMVGCDDNDCKREWFHLPCTGLTTLPRGKWYCDECKTKRSKK